VTTTVSALIFDHDPDLADPKMTETTRVKIIFTILDVSSNRSEDLMNKALR
jgi:hypothetical protein